MEKHPDTVRLEQMADETEERAKATVNDDLTRHRYMQTARRLRESAKLNQRIVDNLRRDLS